MECVIFDEAEIEEMNSAYEVAQYWPNFTLVGMDGGGRGYFKKIGDNKLIYFLGEMGVIDQPNYLCDDFANIDSAINEIEKRNHVEVKKLDIFAEIRKDNLSSIRLIQERLCISVSPIHELTSQIGQVIILGSSIHPRRVEGILSGIKRNGISLLESKVRG